MQKQRCQYCGNNYINHPYSWFNQTMGILTTKLNRKMSRWNATRFVSYLVDRYTAQILAVLGFFRITRWNYDITKAPTDRGKVVWEEAERRGMKMRSVIAFGKFIDSYCAEKNGKKIFYTGLPTGDYADHDAVWWIDDKALLKKKFEKENIPTARGGSFYFWRNLKKRFNEIDKSVIVKPRTGSRGRHTTTSIHTEEELFSAYKIAKQICPFVILEEHLFGSVYRGTVIDGKVVAILRGDPPRITGDGSHTIFQLVEIKNKQRDPRVSEVSLVDVHKDFLKRNGYDFETILPEGKTIDLLEKIGLSYGGSSAEITPFVHPKIFAYLKKAADIIDYPSIGFDFIIEDPEKDPDTQKWGIIEANSSPFINLHHDPLIGTPINVAGFLWDMIERKRYKVGP